MGIVYAESRYTVTDLTWSIKETLVSHFPTINLLKLIPHYQKIPQISYR